ncbi:GNAT family N-acetyltransferase [Nocardioides panacis]|uniref:GNAT family N-acetyltransferase n=1 Tax=Nocardioides panacis TaxID=2849501 RepID=A0A975SXV5_9ACTN|nr:GNAT family N-acetyltransferase [Nocardioides panacis]QWZ07949.1 GNAT family N-acetyltransferase [Nocardioides panacis]
MPQLVLPTVELHAAWSEARADWGPGTHEDGFGLREQDDVESPEGFAAWVRRLRGGPGPASATCWWIVEGEAVLGGIALRHGTDDTVLRLGHVGYGIRPSARGRGLATWALGEVLPVAGATGLDRVLVVCEEGNAASARVVEHHGGVLEEVRDAGPVRVRRYWVATPG